MKQFEYIFYPVFTVLTFLHVSLESVQCPYTVVSQEELKVARIILYLHVPL